MFLPPCIFVRIGRRPKRAKTPVVLQTYFDKKTSKMTFFVKMRTFHDLAIGGSAGHRVRVCGQPRAWRDPGCRGCTQGCTGHGTRAPGTHTQGSYHPPTGPLPSHRGHHCGHHCGHHWSKPLPRPVWEVKNRVFGLKTRFLGLKTVFLV